MLPSFVTVVKDPSSFTLDVSSEFVEEWWGQNFKQNMEVKVVNGQLTWALRVKRVRDEYVFTHGWIKVVRALNLTHGTSLHFKPLQNSTLEMLCFTPNMCGDSFLKWNVDLQSDIVIMPTEFKTEFYDKGMQSMITRIYVGHNSWKVKLERLDNFVCFKDGWTSLMNQASIEDGSQLMFTKIGFRTYEIAVFTKSGNQVLQPIPDVMEIDDIDSDDDVYLTDESDEDEEGYDSDVFWFKKAVGTRFRLPEEVAIMSGMFEGAHPICFRNKSGQEWWLNVRSESNGDLMDRFTIVEWADYVKQNDLRFGDFLIFHYIISSQVVELQFIERKRIRTRSRSRVGTTL